MPSIAYDATRQSLFNPGTADDFFQLGDYSEPDALCAEMARLAYVHEPERLATYLRRAHFSLTQAFGYDNEGTQAFVAARHGVAMTVVAFRGTEPGDVKDFLADAQFIPTDWHDAAGHPLGRVHGGFARYSADDNIFARVKAHLDTLPPDHRVLITGHSLGAALATLLASWVPAAHLYTFGSPRVGNTAFTQSLRNPVSVRFVDCTDLITRLPPRKLLDYQDAGVLCYLDRNGVRVAAPGAMTVLMDRFKAHLGFWRYLFTSGNAPSRGLTDHAPINYVSAVMGLRA